MSVANARLVQVVAESSANSEWNMSVRCVLEKVSAMAVEQKR